MEREIYKNELPTLCHPVVHLAVIIFMLTEIFALCVICLLYRMSLFYCCTWLVWCCRHVWFYIMTVHFVVW